MVNISLILLVSRLLLLIILSSETSNELWDQSQEESYAHLKVYQEIGQYGYVP